MLTRITLCFALAGSVGCLHPTERAGPVASPPRDDRARELERELVEARQEIAAGNASLEQASVRQAALDRRIDELRQLNEEITARLRTAAESAELAAEHACFTPIEKVSERGGPLMSEVSSAETSAAAVEAEARDDESVELLSRSRPPRDELASTLETD